MFGLHIGFDWLGIRSVGSTHEADWRTGRLKS